MSGTVLTFRPQWFVPTVPRAAGVVNQVSPGVRESRPPQEEAAVTNNIDTKHARTRDFWVIPPSSLGSTKVTSIYERKGGMLLKVKKLLNESPSVRTIRIIATK